MTTISKTTTVHVLPLTAFNKFINYFNKWWPKEYTWSKKSLVNIKLSNKINGHCTETGPNHFRCDWGTITGIEKGKYISFKWQISPTRSPEPNSTKASAVRITLKKVPGTETLVTLKHSNFKNHGKGWKEYLEAMNSEKGWEFLLKCYANYCKS